MKKGTVKRRIFISNALMVLVTLFIFLMINIFVIKIYSEAVEEELKNYRVTDGKGDKRQDDWLEDMTIHRDEFIILFAADGIMCIIVLVFLSQLFTKKLTGHIMKPLEELSDGAERIKQNNLTQEIKYTGDVEFENVCNTFNEMQKHILTEQEKNRKYERARTDMIAGISHDLRTPLTAIRGTIKGLIDGVAATKEQQTRFLNTAYRRTGEMDILLNHLFYLSKMETGNMPLTLETIEISGFIRDYASAKEEFMEAGKEEITAAVNGIQAYVSVDTEQLWRIFDNLLENSRKYGERLPLKIEIALNKTPKGICIWKRRWQRYPVAADLYRHPGISTIPG